MVLFVANYPDPSMLHEGMNIRVASIDSVFSRAHRLYLRLSWRLIAPKLRVVSPQVREYSLNPIIHFVFIAYLIARSNTIYVHSVYNALWIFPWYLFHDRIFTDFHGVVPEELAYRKRHPHSELLNQVERLAYNRVEKLAYKKSIGLICVTESMVEHMKAKHGGTRAKFFHIPILSDAAPGTEINDHQRQNRAGRSTVIYVGGTQVWQNIDLMLRAVQDSKTKARYIFATADVSALRLKLASYGLVETIQIDTVPRNKLRELYEDADFGFILRDDVIVNRVACPTKLVEYLACGVVPIILQPKIGDFEALGFQYVLLHEFVSGQLPSRDKCEVMRGHNRKVVADLSEQADTQLSELLAACQ